VDLIEQIGAFLGLAAFIGLAVLVLLYFQQARDVRRLREWAGRAPERAEAAAEEAAATAAKEAGIAPPVEEEEGPSPEAPLRERLASRIPAPGTVRDRLPEPPYLIAIAAAVVVAAVVVVTGAFGLIGGADENKGPGGGGQIAPKDVDVAVLNGNGVGGAPGVPGLAEEVGKDVEAADYKVVQIADAGQSFAESLIMYQPDDRATAEQVESDLKKTLGQTKLQRMTPEIKALAKDALVAVVIGADDSQI
jgi:LytR cell envelope-related transcriptional attenuator